MIEMLGFNLEFLEEVRHELQRRRVAATDAYLHPDDASRFLEENAGSCIAATEDTLGVVLNVEYHRDENVPRGELIMISHLKPSMGVAVGRVVEKLKVPRELSYRDQVANRFEFFQVETAADYAEFLGLAVKGW